MITQEDIDAFIPVDTDEMRMVARTAPPILEKAANEIDVLRAALKPFVDAYALTCEAFGLDVSKVYKTANCVSDPYLKMTDFVAAHAALFGKSWELASGDDFTFIDAKGDTYRYEHYGNAPPPEEIYDGA